MSARVIPADVLGAQNEASDPNISAWVAANAGSGKTHVLAQRVTRLLLNGVDPAKVLCITFTKAAAANMANRVFATLADWTALDDPGLEAAVEAITGRRPDRAQRAAARRLFAGALETPGGLKVQTIHAFCTRLLHQFPFEANVAGRFTVLDDSARAQLLENLSLAVLVDAAAAPEGALGRALATAITMAADRTFKEMVGEAIARRDVLNAWREQAGSLGGALAELSYALGVDPAETKESIEAEFFATPRFSDDEWSWFAAELAQGSKSDQTVLERIEAARNGSRADRLKSYIDIFCTTELEPRKSIVTRAIANRHPLLHERLVAEQGRVCALIARRHAAACRDRTGALLTVADAVLSRYEKDKQRRGLLDYDDLIDHTLTLFRNTSAAWVLYKLDLGIDHVLVDEAQDTSPKQWEIIDTIVREFAAGAGARGSLKRTLFVVGDEKQSIFSFQGAAPHKFAEMRWSFEHRFKAAGLDWRPLRFESSFRSGATVLGAVDEVFARPQAFEGLTADPVKTVHRALPDAAPGLVEIWPLLRADKSREVEGWDAPFDEVTETSPQVRLARKIAATTSVWLRGGRRAGDVLVLVRQRGALFESIIRALKAANLPVAGADRLVLGEHIAVMDLMVLADALLLPDDDLALATVLKSPLFGLDEERVFTLAFGRTQSLRATLATRAAADPLLAELSARLAELAVAARQETPFAFYARVLGPQGGRKRFLARLGGEAADALDEFLSLTLDYERRETPSLQGFVAWLRGAQTEVKRDMEIGRNEVRVMTVHGAKGLEAPIVILADTTTRPSGPRDPRLLPLPGAGVPDAPYRLIWLGPKATDVDPVRDARERSRRAAQDEYRRLLYVAMTRAAEKLIICGTEGQQKRPDGCWYDLVSDALTPHATEEPADDGDGTVLCYRKTPSPRPAAASALPANERSRAQRAGERQLTLPFAVSEPPRPVRAKPEPASPQPKSDVSDLGPYDLPKSGTPDFGRGEAKTEMPAPTVLPDWVLRDAPRDAGSPPISPSHAATEDKRRRLPAEATAAAAERGKAMARGVVIHRLMQSLPDVAPERREAKGQAYLTRSAQEFTLKEREHMLAQVLHIFADARFAPLFAPGSRAEVPIIGRLTRAGRPSVLVSGQVDRLAVTPQAILIADYKTNEPAPIRPEEVPAAYIAQLALYRGVLRRLYQQRAVRAFLVWTHVPDLLELSGADLDAALNTSL
ncbi:MAG: double-strand break repair helicase AddA [Xanthobacteraceae bacterium]